MDQPYPANASPAGTVDPPSAELYTAETVARPVNGFAAVTEKEISLYFEQGYIAVENAFQQAEVTAARDGLVDLIAGGRSDFNNIQFEAGSDTILPNFSANQRQDAVRKLMSFTPFEPRLKALAEHPQLIAVLTMLLKATPERFQDMALMKPPQGREKPWHQDCAYFNFPLGTPVVGVWIALDETGVENGCMHLLPGAHRHGPAVHFLRRDWQICDIEMVGRECVAVPLKPGGCLIFDGLLPHGTPPNRTHQHRRALQFHYAPAGVQRTSDEDRMAVFGSEGKDATC